MIKTFMEYYFDYPLDFKDMKGHGFLYQNSVQ